MRAAMLFVVGTPGGLWATEIAALLSASSLGERAVLAAPITPAGAAAASASSLAALAPSGADAAAWAGVVADGCWSTDTLATDFPHARFLVLVEHPAIGLAGELLSEQEADPTAWLARWCSGAQRLLRHFQHDPSRSLVIDAADVRKDPAAFAALCTDRFGLTWATPPLPVTTDTGDPLAHALAQALATVDGRVQSAFAELQASCAVLLHNTVQPAVPAGPIDAAAAGRRLRELRLAAVQLEEHAAHGERDRGRFDELQLELERLQGVQAERDAQASLASELQAEVLRLHALQDAAVTKARQDVVELRAQADAVRTELQASRRELEAALAQCAAAERNSRTALQERQLFALQVSQMHDSLGQQHRFASACEAQIARLTESMESLTRQANVSRSELERVTQAHASAQRESDASRQKLEASLRERDALLGQARRDIDACKRKHQSLEEAVAAGVPFAHRLRIAPEAMSVTAERVAAPFRSLDLSLQELGFDGRHVGQLSVRLVEHHGNPGIAFFDDSSRQLIASWHESGREGERPFLLLIPGDQNSQSALDAMGSTDWLLLQALVGEVCRQLRRPRVGVAAAAFWSNLAQRLAERLQELPTRFRHDGCNVDAPSQMPASSLTLRFTGVQWATRHLPALTVHWRAAGLQAGIMIDAQATGLQPLSAWPPGDDGALVGGVALPLGRDADDGAKRAAWSALPARDRHFLFDLLEAWPETVARLPRHLLTDAWVAAAADMLPDARRAAGDAGASHRRGLARVAHRLRHGSAAAAA